MKSLVVFYSLTNKTKLAAEAIVEAIASDLVEIKEKEARKPGGLIYLKGGFEAIKDRVSKIAPVEVDVKQYDRVFIGSPIWASRPAPAVNAFIKASNFEGLEIVAFFTMGGDNSDKALQNLKSKIEKSRGKVIGSFAIKTHGLTDEAIKAKAGEAVKSYIY